ncbi:hypothetical protein QG516_20705 [Pedobacter gandavensis]|uniref:hypothetical protein n=1 Tax=Pedobacter gandavensis TaxID=2679963 RepID=UPI0024790E36|nr:hypothetical protein [Pedobacter gandavensis]WGQ08936.1 hypothetical protein QG516_20705 [Pedobacter gandavensis]
MNVNELRIGNYVFPNDEILNGLANPCEVLGILPHQKIAYQENSKDPVQLKECSHDQVNPILINADWLVNRLGFKDNGGGYYQHEDFNFFLFHVEEDEYYDCYKQVPANDDTGDFKTLQHVHKLQNLFFELFDEELINNN